MLPVNILDVNNSVIYKTTLYFLNIWFASLVSLCYVLFVPKLLAQRDNANTTGKKNNGWMVRFGRNGACILPISSLIIWRSIEGNTHDLCIETVSIFITNTQYLMHCGWIHVHLFECERLTCGYVYISMWATSIIATQHIRESIVQIPKPSTCSFLPVNQTRPLGFPVWLHIISQMIC